FLKEWRENILIFALAILFMIALVVLSLTNQRELTLNFSGMFLLLFLPFAALLIGSGGFYSEFKDNAWIYLFSRPIKKETLWLFKYISLLSILAVIFGLFFLVKQILPGLDEILNDIKFPSEFRGILSFSLYFVIPIIAFTISFSISMLYDKQFIVFFVSILVGTALALIYRYYMEFVWNTYYYTGSFRIFGLLIALSFILASILTFVKSDFSQMGRKILTFSKFAGLFIIISLVLGTLGIAKGNLFTGSKKFFPSYSAKHEGDVYIDGLSRGIFKYNSKSDRVERVGGGKSEFDPRFSISGDKIVFLKYASAGRRRWLRNLWLINTDGSEEKVLADTNNPDSPFYNRDFWGNCLFSPDGSKVIFLTGYKNRKSMTQKVTVWWMNTDGTGINKKTLDFPPNYTSFSLVGLSGLTNKAIIVLREKSPTFKKVADKMIEVDLENGSFQTLFDNVDKYNLQLSPTNDFLALEWLDYPEKKQKLVLLNLKSLERKVIFEAELLKLWAMKWGKEGKRIVFSRANELWVYFLDEDRLKKISHRNYEYEVGFDWLADNKRIALMVPVDGEYHLSVLGENFKEEKRIKIPYPVEGPVYVWGLSNKVLMKFRMSPVFRLDLETEKWKKVY
ncbi:MAG: hypothetical protein OEZ52_14625, partial [Candidatus Aminicenantes bacterium]|nr:hypothetical protein [Candidatus Aminicenantes bacterium]